MHVSPMLHAIAIQHGAVSVNRTHTMCFQYMGLTHIENVYSNMFLQTCENDIFNQLAFKKHTVKYKVFFSYTELKSCNAGSKVFKKILLSSNTKDTYRYVFCNKYHKLT